MALTVGAASPTAEVGANEGCPTWELLCGVRIRVTFEEVITQRPYSKIVLKVGEYRLGQMKSYTESAVPEHGLVPIWF